MPKSNINLPGLLIVILFLLLYSNIFPKNIREIDSAGVMITWDDASVDQWYLIRDTLKYYNAKCTFYASFLSGWKEISYKKLKELQDLGNEIGCHSFSHLDANKFQINYGIDKYLETEIYPANDSLRKHGLRIISFSYPYGHFNSITDWALLRIFGSLRYTYFNVPTPLFSVGSPTFYALSLDNGDGALNIPLDQIYLMMEKAKLNGKIFALYGHVPIPYTNNPPAYSTTLDRLIAVIKKAKELGLKFYTASELIDPKINLCRPRNKQYLPPGNVKLVWDSAPSLSSYQVKISTSSTFEKSNIIFDSVISDTSLDYPIQENGKYFWSVSGSNSNGTIYESDSLSFTVDTQTINKYYNDSDTFVMQSFPNPCRNQMILSMLSADDENVKVEIYDILGRLEYETKWAIYPKGSSEIIVKMSELPTGIYFCKVNLKTLDNKKNKSKTIKIIKQK
ncbi:MAG: polysaccharide deacetylase family protein [Ignavibacteria bacterium]|jgi:peptidoglycan/xylan/chitin deacetylase (PgdA/CDA1 family)|nr:polysaccharide deacetylase family protein [Ignavibacteria bacterium]